MWIKNKKTGNVWLVEQEHGERLLKSNDYEKVEKATEQKPKTTRRSRKTSDVDEQSE